MALTRKPTQEEIDARRERLIADLAFLMLESRNRAERYDLWNELQKRIAERSPAQIARMERDKGLR
jgi:hypothetical protein